MYFLYVHSELMKTTKIDQKLITSNMRQIVIVMSQLHQGVILFKKSFKQWYKKWGVFVYILRAYAVTRWTVSMIFSVYENNEN